MGPDGSDCQKWIFPKVGLTELEKRTIIATVVQIGVLVMFNTHIYQFANKYYLQKKGGPIGLRATCAVARLTMLAWDKRWLAVLEENNVELEEKGRYMDDLRVFLFGIKRGWRWYGRELCFCTEWEEEDRQEGIGDLERITALLQAMMAEVFTFLKFTMETTIDFALVITPYQHWMCDCG